MAYADIQTFLYTLLGTITIPPTPGESAITKYVKVGWPDIAAAKNTNGQLAPYYSIIRSSLSASPIDSRGQAETYLDTIQIDCWCTVLGNEAPSDLMERMLVELRAKIKANNASPAGQSAYFLHIASELPKDEPEQKPILKRTMVLVRVYGMR